MNLNKSTLKLQKKQTLVSFLPNIKRAKSKIGKTRIDRIHRIKSCSILSTSLKSSSKPNFQLLTQTKLEKTFEKIYSNTKNSKSNQSIIILFKGVIGDLYKPSLL